MLTLGDIRKNVWGFPVYLFATSWEPKIIFKLFFKFKAFIKTALPKIAPLLSLSTLIACFIFLQRLYFHLTK